MSLARGCSLTRHGELWTVSAGPGMVLYVGDAAGALAYIEQKGLQP